MNSRDLRALARESLQGRWGKAAILTLIYWVITFGISFILGCIPIIGQIAYAVIAPVLSFGFLVSLIQLSRNENPGTIAFLNNGLPFLGKLWGIILHTFLKMILPILLIVAGAIILSVGTISESALSFIGFIIYLTGLVYMIIKSFSYVLTSYILNAEPTLTSKEIVEKSEILMKGNKWRYFCLGLSFIGWIILTSLTFGIGYFWLLPYIQIANLKFYEELDNSKNTATGTDYDSLA